MSCCAPELRRLRIDTSFALVYTLQMIASGANMFVYTGAQPSSALLDCKLSTGLKMPEDLAAVAHGDATLNLDNFMHQVHA